MEDETEKVERGRPARGEAAGRLGRLLIDELRVCVVRSPPWEEEVGRVEMDDRSVCSLRE